MLHHPSTNGKRAWEDETSAQDDSPARRSKQQRLQASSQAHGQVNCSASVGIAVHGDVLPSSSCEHNACSQPTIEELCKSAVQSTRSFRFCTDGKCLLPAGSKKADLLLRHQQQLPGDVRLPTAVWAQPKGPMALHSIGSASAKLAWLRSGCCRHLAATSALNPMTRNVSSRSTAKLRCCLGNTSCNIGIVESSAAA